MSMGRKQFTFDKQMAPRKSPKDSQCPHCKRFFTAGGLKQHMRFVKCSPASTASPRKFERVRCKHCGKSFHSTNSLRVHVSTRHPKEYSRSPGHMKHHRSSYKATKKKTTENINTGNNSHAEKTRRPSPATHGQIRHEHRAPPEHRQEKNNAESNKFLASAKWERELLKKMGEAAAREDRR